MEAGEGRKPFGPPSGCRLYLVGGEKSLKVYTSAMIRSVPSESHTEGM